MNDKLAAQASNAFGMALMQALIEKPGSENLFVSPPSVFLALAMTANGATPATRTPLLRGLHLPDDLNQSNAACSGLLKTLTQKVEGVEMELAQALWAFSGNQFARDVQARIQAAFDAELHCVTLGEGAQRINDWASQKTHRMIQKVVESTDLAGPPPAEFALSNATYFKGIWSQKFDPQQTRPLPFQRPDGSSRPVPMMHAAAKLECWSTPAFSGVRLPYGTGRFQLYAFLPARDKTPESLLPQLSLFDGSWRQEIRAVEAELYLPKMVLDPPRLELLPTLHKLKMLGDNDVSLLTQNPDPRRPLEIGKVLHKTKLEIDEEGTRAAAVTVVIVRTRGGRGGPPLLIFNRPFVLAIADETTQTALFWGIVNQPG